MEVDTNQLDEIQENIKVGLVGSQLVIVIDTEHEIGLSSTGKMMGVASSGGFIRLPGGLSGNIYIGKKEKKP